ncbi:MAG: tyrosine-protein phosphatase [Pyrinomonadaceae bacterium]
MVSRLARILTPFFVLTIIFAATAFSQTSPSKDFPGIKIDNFGQMDEHYYRGARPKEGKGQFAALKALGVQTVIDLQDDPKPWEKVEAEAAGLRYINIPMADGSYPDPKHIEEFLKLANDPEVGVFFAHCAGGRHRTGITAAAYRMTKYGWGIDQAYKEMKNYDFYSSWGHGAQKDFVYDFAAKQEAAKTAAAAVGTSASANQPK